MDELKKYISYLLFNFITGLAAGILCGFIMFTVLISYHIEEYHKKINILESIIEDKDIQLDRLEQERIQNKGI